jgi:hypothetical protein
MAPTPANVDELADRLRPTFNNEAFRVDRRRPLTFICGGKISNGSSGLRHQFLKHVSSPPLRIVPVLAEKTFAHQLVERNLKTFEEFLASAAECVLIFVESPGSFAETGLFSALKDVVPKTFVVNTREDARKDSFLNTGPIKLIRRKSQFDTVFELPERCVTGSDADGIVERILATCTKYENALVFQRESKFTDLKLLLQLGCIQLIVTLIGAGSTDLVTGVLRKYFKAVERDTVERLLSLLTGISLLGRSDELYFNPRPGGIEGDQLISSVAFSADSVKVRAFEWQSKNNSQASIFLREHLNIGI